ncbi:hypothetical protein UFOVP1540_30 [uncultured Caudovirales phage]|uniref:Uncharacterized protein n=4 Tax=uncultured Caudovirales phage TaxID=2100421 RepID=A0A6J7XE26_9CAUD|nr:hypothetical protein UFOVP1540_30 [uncultured Caudovirales phage]
MGAEFVRGRNPRVLFTGRGAVRTLYKKPKALGKVCGDWSKVCPTFSHKQYNGNFTINTVAPTGITKNSSNVALPNCRVDLFRADATQAYIATTYSDGSGNYSFAVGSNAGYFFCRAYLPGSPDVAGTTTDVVVAV